MVIRILIVDDHALVRDGVRALLAGAGDCEVVGEAADAAQARALIDAQRPDLVLLDVGMKDVDGITFAAELASERPELAVLMLSMYDGAEYVRRAREAGARGYVLKDGPSDTILEAIATIAAGGTHFPAVAEAADAAAGRRGELSEREREILRALARGQSSKQIAALFDLSVRTVETHRQNIRRKLKIEGQAELIRYAVQHFRPPGAA